MATDQERHDQGMVVRREVLSDAHVDRATAAATDLTADWQDFITRVAWGDVWSRPGLDRRSRSVAVLSSLIAHGHQEELAMRQRATAIESRKTANFALVLPTSIASSTAMSPPLRVAAIRRRPHAPA